VFDFQTQDQLYKELHALAQSNSNGIAAPVNTIAPPAADAPVVAKTIASSSKPKKQAQAK
jgi:hypothetical protein